MSKTQVRTATQISISESAHQRAMKCSCGRIRWHVFCQFICLGCISLNYHIKIVVPVTGPEISREPYCFDLLHILFGFTASANLARQPESK